MNSYRQGDVLIVEVDAIPADAVEVPREAGRIILARGEATGHAHAIESQFAHLLAKGAERYLRNTGSVSLRHEEHSEIRLPEGTWRVIRQREYSPAGLRDVAD